MSLFVCLQMIWWKGTYEASIWLPPINMYLEVTFKASCGFAWIVTLQTLFRPLASVGEHVIFQIVSIGSWIVALWETCSASFHCERNLCVSSDFLVFCKSSCIVNTFWILASVRQNMRLQNIFSWEGFDAMSASVLFFCNMSQKMRLEVTSSGKYFATVCTFVRSNSSVRNHVFL